MSDAVFETSPQHIHSAVAASDGGHGKHRGAASGSEQPRTSAAGSGRHRRPNTGSGEEAAA
jgi:hypothetical protein